MLVCAAVMVACGGDDSVAPIGGDSSSLPDTSFITDSGPPDSASIDGADTAAARGLHVEANKLVDQGKVVRLLGVNHSGGEYACDQGYGIFEGPTDDTLVLPMLTWKANTVRLPINEQCWLGINGIKPQYAGKNYQDALFALVTVFRKHNMYVILDLHFAAPGTHLADAQQPMVDADHGPTFWKEVAAAYKGDLGVLFDIFNEPYLDSGNIVGNTDPWNCLQNGCTAQLQRGSTGNYQTAGTQSLVDAIRSTGSENIIMVPGLAYTSDLSGWLTHKPTDPKGNIVASNHLYNFNGCIDVPCWDQKYKAVSQAVPLVSGENGEDDCAHGFVDAYMTWADGLGTSYLGWTWNTWNCNQGPALITKYDGTPTAFGVGLMKHLQGL